MSKKDRVPRRQLVVELAQSNARVIELANDLAEWQERHANAMRIICVLSNQLEWFSQQARESDAMFEEMKFCALNNQLEGFSQQARESDAMFEEMKSWLST